MPKTKHSKRRDSPSQKKPFQRRQPLRQRNATKCPASVQSTTEFHDSALSAEDDDRIAALIDGASPSSRLSNKSSQPNMNAWDYDDESDCGPRHWPNGKHQSPIDLRLSKMNVVTLKEPLQFQNYDHPLHGEFLNNGHSVQFKPDPTETVPTIFGGMLEQPYKFVQYHYHWAQHDTEGSEHTLCGLRYPAELHLVHQGVEDSSKLAVLGVFLHLGDSNRALNADARILNDVVEFETTKRTREPICLEYKLPESRGSFARYNGSLTTPPCSENVVWTIFTDPVEITEEQLEKLRAVKDGRGTVIRKNYRPLQSLNDRKIFLAC